MGADFYSGDDNGNGARGLTAQVEFAETGGAGAVGAEITDAEKALNQLAEVFLQQPNSPEMPVSSGEDSQSNSVSEAPELNLEARYRALVEQIPAVVFMAYLDKGIGEAYVSPQIEAALGFSQSEWLEDPVRWYRQVHPDDKARWSVEAAEMFLSGKPLRSAYRVLARDGRVLWFQCEAKMIRKPDGRPWFIHGVGFDITDLKMTEDALEEERSVLSAILDTVGALVAVLNPDGRIVRFNRLWEATTGYSAEQMKGKAIWDLFPLAEDAEDFHETFLQAKAGEEARESETLCITPQGDSRSIAWAFTVLKGRGGATTQIVATGVDVTERRKMEQTVLEVSAREQRRIGQDLHDGLGQHLTGIAFLSKVMAQQLAERSYVEAREAEKIVRLVNQAIEKTRELAQGLLPVVSEGHGLMSALQRRADEVQDVCDVDCWFRCETPVLIDDVSVATHLYHIAQEAVNNALKHGKPRMISIQLSAEENAGTLIVDDNGTGFQGAPAKHSGLGLGIMSHRASMIGGSLDVRRTEPRGTRVTCTFPVRNVAAKEAGDADTRTAEPNATKQNFSH
jgi:PAS domain S-box-containing protein